MSILIYEIEKKMKAFKVKLVEIETKIDNLEASINIARTQIIAIAQKVGAEITDPGVE